MPPDYEPELGNEDKAFLLLLKWAAVNVATAEPYAVAWIRVNLGGHSRCGGGFHRGTDGEPVCSSCGEVPPAADVPFTYTFTAEAAA